MEIEREEAATTASETYSQTVLTGQPFDTAELRDRLESASFTKEQAQELVFTLTELQKGIMLQTVTQRDLAGLGRDLKEHIRSSVEDLRREMTQRVDGLSDRIGKIETRLATLDERSQGLQKQLDDVRSDLKNARTRSWVQFGGSVSLIGGLLALLERL